MPSCARRPTAFSTPGHKRNPALIGDDPLLANDSPMHGGADDLRGGKRIRARAEELAAAAFGADLCRFSGNGSTHPNQALCLAVASEGEPVIVSRCSHKSVAAGLVLSGARPVWVAPAVDEARGVALGHPVEAIEAALDAEPGRARDPARRARPGWASCRTSRASPSSRTRAASR